MELRARVCVCVCLCARARVCDASKPGEKAEYVVIEERMGATKVIKISQFIPRVPSIRRYAVAHVDVVGKRSA